MTPAEALNLIDQVAGAYQGTRGDHDLLRQAIDTFRELAAKTTTPSRTTPTPNRATRRAIAKATPKASK